MPAYRRSKKRKWEAKLRKKAAQAKLNGGNQSPDTAATNRSTPAAPNNGISTPAGDADGEGPQQYGPDLPDTPFFQSQRDYRDDTALIRRYGTLGMDDQRSKALIQRVFQLATDEETPAELVLGFAEHLRKIEKDRIDQAIKIRNPPKPPNVSVDQRSQTVNNYPAPEVEEPLAITGKTDEAEAKQRLKLQALVADMTRDAAKTETESE